MFDVILKRLQERIRTRHYIMTVHAVEEMEEDKLTVFDVENCLLTGTVIERQRDRETGEWKYIVRGLSLADSPFIVVAKIGLTGKLVIITVFIE